MRTNILIIVLSLALAAGVGYIAYDTGRTAGIAEARASISSILTDRAAAGQAGNGQVPPAGGRGGGNPLGALFGGLQGPVDKVDGNTLSVTVTRGQQTQSVKVTVASPGVLQQISGANLGDIKAGSRVIIGVDQAQGGGTPAAGQGQQIPSEVAARSILILPSNFGQ